MHKPTGHASPIKTAIKNRLMRHRVAGTDKPTKQTQMTRLLKLKKG